MNERRETEKRKRKGRQRELDRKMKKYNKKEEGEP